MKTFSDMLVTEPRFGLLGGWVYLPSEWNETLAQHKTLQLKDYRVFQNGWVAGCIFLGRLQLLRQYSSSDPGTWGTPLKQMDITRDGFISGYPLPIVFAENLDDPRSPHCRMNRPGGWDQFAAYSARIRKFAGPKEYGEWIAADANSILTTPVKEQIQDAFPTSFQLLRRKLTRGVTKLRRLGVNS
jgi:hypothetical protein